MSISQSEQRSKQIRAPWGRGLLEGTGEGFPKEAVLN